MSRIDDIALAAARRCMDRAEMEGAMHLASMAKAIADELRATPEMVCPPIMASGGPVKPVNVTLSVDTATVSDKIRQLREELDATVARRAARRMAHGDRAPGCALDMIKPD